ncbi:MAG: hypothetical protein GY952_09520 [Rhodobacteraceae bacterium]|nr:hypothetical protein [Paracoccaceae bacterium]
MTATGAVFCPTGSAKNDENGKGNDSVMSFDFIKLDWSLYSGSIAPNIVKPHQLDPKTEKYAFPPMEEFLRSRKARIRRLKSFTEICGIPVDGSVNGIVELNRFFCDLAVAVDSAGFLSPLHTEFCSDVAVYLGEQILARNSAQAWRILSVPDKDANYHGELGLAPNGEGYDLNHEFPIVFNIVGYAGDIGEGFQLDMESMRESFFLGAISGWSLVDSANDFYPRELGLEEAIEMADLQDLPQ